MKNNIIDLFHKGKTYSQIIEELGCSKSTVSYHLKGIRNFKSKELENKIEIECSFCGEILRKRKSKIHNTNFCSNSHRQSYFNILNKDKLSEWGYKSIKNQGDNRRSKNEIYFFELCFEKFKNVTNNEVLFNGWDSDIIIHDLKIAILWNGKWHYEKITKNHSVEQVQNRDRIKKIEIIKCGYTPYEIKDMGKYNKSFVDEQFKLFIENTAG